MAKSYKSALPTWTTYTPYMGPVSTQAAINQENWWRNRAHGYTPLSTAGHFNRIAQSAVEVAGGTGAGARAYQTIGNNPILNELAKRGGDRGQSSAWYRKMQEAAKQGTPEAETALGEAPAQSEMQVRAARTAPATVNPADVQAQQAAWVTAATLGQSAITSQKTGTYNLPFGVVGTTPTIPVPKPKANK